MYDEVQDLIQKCGRRESLRRESECDHERMIEVNELMVEILNVVQKRDPQIQNQELGGACSLLGCFSFSFCHHLPHHVPQS